LAAGSTAGAKTKLMTSLGLVLAVTTALFVVVGLAWRFASRRQSLPCPAWLQWMVELDNPFTQTNRAAVIVRRLDVAPGMAVLDIGCGPGRVAIPLALAVGADGHVTAMDIQSGMLARAAAKARQTGVTNIRFMQTGLGEGKLTRAHYDRAVLVTVLGEIVDREAALRELFAAMKPGGIVSVVEVVFDPHFQTRATVRRLAAGAGFKERALYGHRLAYAMNWEKLAV
jgi:ubiquinone/menaquinone biosynthesis C-methylase UbiE